jgi:hypothetical protein
VEDPSASVEEEKEQVDGIAESQDHEEQRVAAQAAAEKKREKEELAKHNLAKKKLIDGALARYSPTHKNLLIHMQSAFTCANEACKSERASAEEYYDITLDIPTPGIDYPGLSQPVKAPSDERDIGTPAVSIDLRVLLELFFRTEPLEYRCGEDQCDSVLLHSHNSLMKLPVCLVLHIGRFVPNYDTNKFEKNNSRIVFGQSLDMLPYVNPKVAFVEDQWTCPTCTFENGPDNRAQCSMCAKSRQQDIKTTYKLVAVVNHEGSTAYCGHYTTHGRDPQGVWYKYNDSVSRRLNKSEVINAKTHRDGYILMYVKE